MDKLNAFIEHLEADEDREAAANEAYQQELFKNMSCGAGTNRGSADASGSCTRKGQG